MRKSSILLALVLITLANEISAQDFSFTYDASGNRTDRSILLSKSTASQSSDDSTKIKRTEESLGNVKIILYPNPTNDDVFISILNNDAIISSSLSVYDNTGRLMKTKSNLDINSAAGISGFPPGNYFLIVNINGETSRWQIIKEK